MQAANPRRYMVRPMIGGGHRLVRNGEMIMNPAASFCPTRKAGGRNYRRTLLAILTVAAVISFGLGSAKQVRAEPPDPCHHECEF
jgi:hypothetical protein